MQKGEVKLLHSVVKQRTKIIYDVSNIKMNTSKNLLKIIYDMVLLIFMFSFNSCVLFML